jgi:hypothetical protein
MVCVVMLNVGMLIVVMLNGVTPRAFISSNVTQSVLIVDAGKPQ